MGPLRGPNLNYYFRNRLMRNELLECKFEEDKIGGISVKNLERYFDLFDQSRTSEKGIQPRYTCYLYLGVKTLI
ncbi:hypothetical protein CN284_08365 [Bacillus cereus]|nr:hypothetical protein CN284_08365 [Bacillus cereus]